MTMHRCKGLEFKVVYILDTNEGITPHHKADFRVRIVERKKRRMFYVANDQSKGPAAYFFM